MSWLASFFRPPLHYIKLETEVLNVCGEEHKYKNNKTKTNNKKKMSHVTNILYSALKDTRINIVSVLEQEEGYTVKLNPLPEGVPQGDAQGNF